MFVVYSEPKVEVEKPELYEQFKSAFDRQHDDSYNYAITGCLLHMFSIRENNNVELICNAKQNRTV